MGNPIGNNLHLAGTHMLHSPCKDDIEIHWTYVKKEQQIKCVSTGPLEEGPFAGDS